MSKTAGKPKPSKTAKRRGTAAVEFAVVMPLFLLLLAGIIEFGQAFRIQHALTNVSRRVARTATVGNQTTINDLETKIVAQCAQTLGTVKEDLIVDIKVNGVADADLQKAEQGDEIAVTISVPFNKVGAGFYANLFSNSQLSSTCVLEHE